MELDHIGGGRAERFLSLENLAQVDRGTSYLEGSYDPCVKQEPVSPLPYAASSEEIHDFMGAAQLHALPLLSGYEAHHAGAVQLEHAGAEASPSRARRDSPKKGRSG